LTENEQAFAEGEADFLNTLVVEGFAGFDANGNPVDLWDVRGSDGTSDSTVRVQPPDNDGAVVDGTPG
jgi:hypothetical protein